MSKIILTQKNKNNNTSENPNEKYYQSAFPKDLFSLQTTSSKSLSPNTKASLEFHKEPASTRVTPVPVNLITTGTQSRRLFEGTEHPFLIPEVEVIFAQKRAEKREKDLIKSISEKINTSSYTKKAILSGKILETYTYSRPQKQPVNMLDFQKMNKNTATPENLEKNRKESLYRAKKKLKRIINSNIDRGKNADVFLTLTFQKNIQDVKKANRYLTLFAQRLRNYLLNHKRKTLKYTACIEFQRRGAIHYHLSLFDFPYIHQTILAELWGYGYLKIKKLSTQADIGSYMTKYLTKNADTEKLKGQKTYWTSKNLEKPLVILGYTEMSKRALEILEKETSKKLLYYFSFNTEYQGFVSYSKYFIEDNIKNVLSSLHNTLEGEI